VVHEVLSQAPDETAPFDAVADQVLAMCAEVAAPESAVRVRARARPGLLPAEVATPLALVLTELVQNAVEHGFPGGRDGTVRVRFDRTDGALVVRADDGAGLPAGFVLGASPAGPADRRHAGQSELRGTLALVLQPDGGTAATVEVPLPQRVAGVGLAVLAAAGPAAAWPRRRQPASPAPPRPADGGLGADAGVLRGRADSTRKACTPPAATRASSSRATRRKRQRARHAGGPRGPPPVGAPSSATGLTHAALTRAGSGSGDAGAHAATAQRAALVLVGAAPHAGVLRGLEGPGQALLDDGAATADDLGLLTW
jgi:hypothetical protein